MPEFTLHDRFNVCRLTGMPGIPREELLGYMLAAAESLDQLNIHHQIQHLGVSPKNLILTSDGTPVADCGLMRELDEFRSIITKGIPTAESLERIRTMSDRGVVPVYAAPETFEGNISSSTDQYSLAMVYQEMLTGVRPLIGSNTREMLMHHLNGTPNLGPLPERDRPIVGRGLSKKPEDRYLSCVMFVWELMGVTAEPAE